MSYQRRRWTRVFVYFMVCLFALPPGFGTSRLKADINWNEPMTRDSAMEALRNPQISSSQYNRFWNTENPWQLLCGGGEGLKRPRQKGYGNSAEPNAVWLPHGRLEWSESDAYLPGLTFDLSFQRIYRSSISSYDGPLGNVWDHTWNKRVEVDGLDYHLFDMGRIDTYVKDGPSSSTFTSPAGRYDTFWLDGSDIYREDRFGITERYLADGGTDFRLYRIEDLHGNTLSVDWTSSPDYIRVTNDVGFSFRLYYENDTQEANYGRITRIRDSILLTEGVNDYYREWLYSYDGDGNLTKVRTPTVDEPGTEHDYLSGKETLYGYDASDRLNEVYRPGDTSTPSWAWEYDTSGRVTKETVNGNAINIEYDDTNSEVTVEDRVGNEVVYEYDASDDITKRKVLHTSGSYDTEWSYNSDHEIESVTFPLGNIVEYDYDSEGNILSVEFKEGLSDTTPLTWAYEYGDNSRLTKLTDPNSRAWEYEYNADGDLTKKIAPTLTVPTDSGNHITLDLNGNGTIDSVLTKTYDYDSYGNLTHLTDELDNEFVFEYDKTADDISFWMTKYIKGSQFGGLDIIYQTSRSTVWLLETYTDPISRVYTYEYNDLNDLLEIDEPEGVTKHYYYDLNGDITRQKQSNDTVEGNTWHEWDMTFDQLSNITQLITDLDATSRLTTTYAYDKNDRLTRLSEPGNVITDYGYDERDLRTTYTRKSGTDSVTVTVYDANANAVTIQDPRHTTSAPIETILTYDGYSQVTKVTRPEGDYKLYAYDDASNLTSLKSYNSSATKLAETTYAYDEANRLYETERWAVEANPAITIGDGWQTSTYRRDEDGNVLVAYGDVCGCAASDYIYDDIGRLITIQDALAGSDRNTRVLAYDDADNLTKVIQKDSSQVPSIDASKDIETSFVYDGRDRLVTLKQKLAVGSTADTIFSYGKRDQLIEIEDPVGDTVEIEYNEQLWETTRTIPIGTGGSDDVIIEHDYDFSGRKVTYRAKNSDTGDQETRYEYDPLYRLVTVHWPSAAGYDDKTTHTYDEASNRISTKDPESVIQDRSYDDNNRLTTIDVTHPGTIGATQLDYGWDALDRLIYADTFEGTSFYSNVDRTYNSLSLLESETQAIDGYTGRTVSYDWNIQGQKMSTTYPMSGETISYDRDNLDRVTAISRGLTEIVKYEFSGQRVLRKTLPDSRTELKYDGYGRLTQKHHVDTSGNKLATFDYAYDDAHQMKWQDKSFYDGSHIRITADETDIGDQYAYDEAKRLVTVLRGVATGDIVTAIGTNASNSSTYSTKVEYHYDQTGNRTELEINDATDTTYDYNTVNEMTGIDSSSLTYHDDGNLAAKGSWLYKYDYNNQLVKIIDTTEPLNRKIYTYHYDALGRWVARDNSHKEAQVRQYYDGWHTTDRLIYKNSTETPLRRYFYGARLDELVLFVDVQADPDVEVYAHLDHLGSVSLLVDSAGDVVQSYRYTEFGEYRILDDTFSEISVAAVKNAVMYTGRFVIGPLGPSGEQWYDYRFRMMRADVGRFSQRDPLGHVDGPSSYPYVASNPLSMVDPYGRAAQDAPPGGTNPFGNSTGETIQTIEHGMAIDRYLQRVGFVKGLGEVTNILLLFRRWKKMDENLRGRGNGKGLGMGYVETADGGTLFVFGIPNTPGDANALKHCGGACEAELDALGGKYDLEGVLDIIASHESASDAPIDSASDKNNNRIGGALAKYIAKSGGPSRSAAEACMTECSNLLRQGELDTSGGGTE